MEKELDGETASRRRKGRDLTWTANLLAHLWTAFFVPLHADSTFPFGSIAFRLSGPKPDPFLALVPPPRLPLGLTAQPHSDHTVDDLGLPSTSPVRPEMGDHIRLYCDLKYALSLRTWLHAIEVDQNQFNSKTVVAAGETLFRPFDKTRLVLVGPRGEALVVA